MRIADVEQEFRRLLIAMPRLILRANIVAITACSVAAALLCDAAVSERSFELSYSAGARDGAGRFMGGTEIRVLTAHAGKLYAGNGYWEDRPGPEGTQGAQILVLDGPRAQWHVDHAFDERLPNGRARNLAVSALSEVTFATDAFGKRLSKPAVLLFASTWDLTGSTRIFVRDDDAGGWIATTLAQDRATPDFLPQVRSFGFHHDGETGTDYVFAGQDPRGIFRGSYDATVAGRIRWSGTPELDIARISTVGHWKNGKMDHEWLFWDNQDFMNQIGLGK